MYKSAFLANRISKNTKNNLNIIPHNTNKRRLNSLLIKIFNKLIKIRKIAQIEIYTIRDQPHGVILALVSVIIVKC